MAYLEECMSKALIAKERLFAGFDFAFGFPIGSTDLPGGGRWETVWSWLASEINDGDDNCSNRFEVATRLNAMFENGGPFWGHPHTHAGRYAGLLPKKPCYDDIGVSEKRGIDTVVTSAQPVWKLASIPFTDSASS